ncbi:MAG TPA: 1-acyl-sn-glycerol-3-phosphate acyltransferase [Thermoanaerobaculia bacterium]|jgi:glycerol-3-phosphate O-acyltransferase|nr:1-acyl-sn-glycerol-3-phosphate acyltransferase [Thermoanaerobaculia bacterium]
MTRVVTLPLWLAVVLLVLAAWAAVERLLVPSARWLLRRRVNRVLEELSTRLKIRIPPFKLTRREVLISRLVEDPQIERAAEAASRESGASLPSLRERIRRYAVEIVPAFNAYLYFRVGYAIGRNLARRLYRVRLGYADEPALAAIPNDATVVFLINHRSNMDYVLVAYLVAERAALSYAVGEWARIWPLQVLIRSMGAYFVRRNSKDPLYRKVLERYVAMATEAGVTQAVFPEGGLSRDGRLRPPRLGILDYMVRGFDPKGERDVIFIPTGINYDRTLEDRTLLAGLDGSAPGRTRATANTLRFLARNVRLMASNSWHRFGYACVNFGAPVSLRAYLGRRGFDFRGLSREEHSRRLEELARELMEAVARVIPVVPVSLVASVFVSEPSRAWSELELKAEVARRIEELEARGAHIYVPRQDQDYAIQVGLRMLTLRRLVSDSDGIYRARAEELPLLAYYANSIEHLFA